MLVFRLLALVVVAAAQKDPHSWANRSAIVHLFEWKFSDIAAECERFLATKGYAGVQTSPVSECLELAEEGRPWWERYQPISYKIISRSGNETAFADMVRRCNKVGVRIYVDVVFNHMTRDWKNAHGYGASTADTYKRQYYAVPYGPSDFRKECSIENYQDSYQVRNCELNGLHDLNQSSEYVTGKIIEFLNSLVHHGVAGFRVDAAKHMWPADLQNIFRRIKNLNTAHGFAANSRPFIYQEVIDLGGEPITNTEYTSFGRVTEFMYGVELGNAFRGNNHLRWLQNFGTAWGLLSSHDALVFIDNHDNQRGHGASDSRILTFKDSRLYKMAVAFMLAWPYGYPRVMSSYFFENPDQGPPAYSDGLIKDVTIDNNGICGNGWVCEHRWRQIYNMVDFRNHVQGTEVLNWWDNGNKQIAFSRGNRGFIAFNGQLGEDLKQTLQTGLPKGNYCNVIFGSKSGICCNDKFIMQGLSYSCQKGNVVRVGDDGKAYIEILDKNSDGVLAIYVGGKLQD